MSRGLAIIPCVCLNVLSAFGAERACDMIWMTDSDVFRSWNPNGDFHAFMQIDPTANGPKRLILSDYEMRVCSADFKTSCTVRFKVDFHGQFENWMGEVSFNKEQVQTLQALGPGTFHAAFFVDGVRCSNLLSISINPSHPDPSGPSIIIIGIPDLDKNFIKTLGLRVVPPDQGYPKLLDSSIFYPDLLVDATRRRPALMAWCGPDGPLPPHKSTAALVDLSNYEPKIDRKDSYAIQAIVGSYTSRLTDIKPDRDVEHKFDQFFLNNGVKQ